MVAKVRAEGLESSGFQPWLTQVPPSGLFSTSAMRVPILVAPLRAVRPAEPLQITSRSWRPWWSITSQILAPEQPQSAIRGHLLEDKLGGQLLLDQSSQARYPPNTRCGDRHHRPPPSHRGPERTDAR